jgi:CBS domain-containing protein
MSVGEICNRDTVVIGKEESIVAAAKLLRQFHVGSVVVVDRDNGIKPVGILTDRDLVVEILAAELDPNTVSVGDIMSYELTTAREDEGLWDALQRMRAKGVRRMPVVDAQGALIGILSSDDLLELLADELGQLARIIGKEREREQKVRGDLD